MRELLLAKVNEKRSIRGCVLACCLVFTAGAAGAAVSVPLSGAEQTLKSLPAWFEPNTGQFSPAVKYFSRRGAGTLLVGHSGARLDGERGSLGVEFKGARRRSLIEGAEPAGARSSYFLGNDPRKWRQGIQHYSKVRAREVYPGIDVVYYLAGRQLEFDLVVAPGADPARIRMAFNGAGAAKLDEDGNLIFPSGARQNRPFAYQEAPSGRVAIEARYRLAVDGCVTLELGRHDRSRPLVIDPVLQIGYLGGSTSDAAKAMTVDRQGNVWITGSSASTITLPTQNAPIQDAPRGKKDIFLAKLSPDSTGKLSLAYWTQLGGASDEEAEAIAVDNSGFVFLTGYTTSSDFPRQGSPLQTDFGGKEDAFVAMIRPADSGIDALWYSQFYGGADTDIAYALALDPAGGVYFAGYTLSDSLKFADATPTQAAGQGGYEGFFVKVVPTSSTPLSFATYFGGSSTDVITALASPSPGIVYMAGYTASSNFPVTGDGFQQQMASSVDSFLVRLDLSKTGLDSLVYGTYFGGSGLDVIRTVQLDNAGGLWLAGYTFSQDLPVTPDAYRTVLAGAADVFLTRLDLSKLSLPNPITYSTYIGGGDTDVVYGMALAPGGRVALAGYTMSTDFPLIGGTPTPPRSAEAFVSLLDPSKSGPDALVYSDVFGGSLSDAATGIGADASGKLIAAGFTTSFDFPVTDGSSKPAPGGATQSFVIEVAP